MKRWLPLPAELLPSYRLDGYSQRGVFPLPGCIYLDMSNASASGGRDAKPSPHPDVAGHLS